MAKQSLKLGTPATAQTTDNDERGGSILENRRLLAYIGIGLLALLGGIYTFFYFQGKSNDRAQLELARIRPYYDKSEFAIAIKGDSSKMIGGAPVHGLTYIVNEWKSTQAGKIAALYLGNSYLATGQTDKAAEPFDIATGASAPLVRSAAYAGLAAVQEAAKKYEDAAKNFDKAASEDQVELNTPEYLMGAARNYEQAGNKEKAIELYRRIATQYSDAAVNTEARLALARHNVTL
jgi:tetratricopeptide (TPR) repeat protein